MSKQNSLEQYIQAHPEGPIRVLQGKAFAPGIIDPDGAADVRGRGGVGRWQGGVGVADRFLALRKNAGGSHEWADIPTLVGSAKGVIPVFNVRDFNAKADGTTDDSTVFQDVIDAIAAVGGGTMYVPGNATYKLNTGLTINDSNIAIEMGPGAVLDFTGMGSGGTALLVAGSESSFTDLTADAAAGDLTIDVTDATGMAAGVWLRVRSDEEYDPDTTSTPCGEIVRVDSVSGTTITLVSPLVDDYATADTARVSVLTPIEGFSLRGGRFHGPAATATNRNCLQLKFCIAPLVEAVSIDHFTPHNCNIDCCVQARIAHCEITDAVQSLGYGVALSNCTQDSIVTNCVFRGMRHAISTNNGLVTGGIPRRNIFSLNTVYDWFGIGGIDNHTACEDMHVFNNIMIGGESIGINLESRNPVVRGNTIIRPDNVGISIAHAGPRDSAPIVEDNRVYDPSSVGILVSGNSVTITTGHLREASVSRNVVVGGASDGIRVTNAALTGENTHIKVDDNRVVDCAPSIAAIYVTGVKKGTVSRNIVGNSAGIGIRIRDSKDMTVTGNVIELPSSSSASCIYLESSSSGSISGIVVDDNRATAISPTATVGLRVDNNAQNCTFGLGNDFRGNTTETSYGTGSGHRIPTRIAQPLTAIATGAISIDNMFVQKCIVDTEASAATDDLDTINAPSPALDGQRITFRQQNSSRDVTFKDGTGNLRLAGDYNLASANNTITLMWEAATSAWHEVARSTNG